jgi:hypothetical protein
MRTQEKFKLAEPICREFSPSRMSKEQKEIAEADRAGLSESFQ